MRTQAAPGMRTDRHTDVPLRSVSVHGRVRGLLFELSVEQSYENTSSRNVEAVYTFPVPLRAVLLGLEMKIGEKELTAVAARKEAAAEEYEEAVGEGHTAALLERSGDGLYTLSVGNLMAGERAVIRYRYAELLDRSGDYVRLRIPTVIAPRYGEPEAHGLAPHQRPETDLTVEYPFEVSIDLEGEIANAAVSCPSHAVTVARTETGTRLGLAKGATLDRDFVLEMSGAATRAQAVVATGRRRVRRDRQSRARDRRRHRRARWRSTWCSTARDRWRATASVPRSGRCSRSWSGSRLRTSCRSRGSATGRSTCRRDSRRRGPRRSRSSSTRFRGSMPTWAAPRWPGRSRLHSRSGRRRTHSATCC